MAENTQKITVLTDPLPLAQALIAEPSVTPEAAGCFDLIERWLETLGFSVQRMVFEGDGGAPTENLYARRGEASPNLCFAGHVDVVPPGDAARWHSPPFAPEVRDGVLYGRGAEDMKAAIACMIAAIAQQADSTLPSLSFLLTADEEGNAINGTPKLLRWLEEQGETLDYCLVGEPTNPGFIGEMAKIGRRGSLLCQLTVTGKQGHVAYPHLAHNPITPLTHILHRLVTTSLDDGTEYFQPSNLEVTTVDVGNEAHNTIPAEASAEFNIRFNDRHTGEKLQVWVREHCDAIGGDYELSMRISGEAFLSPEGTLPEALVTAVQEVTGHTPELSTTGGTSDARFIRELCPVIEFGTTNLTAHHVNECVRVADLYTLRDVYAAFLREMAGEDR